MFIGYFSDKKLSKAELEERELRLAHNRETAFLILSTILTFGLPIPRPSYAVNPVDGFQTPKRPHNPVVERNRAFFGAQRSDSSSGSTSSGNSGSGSGSSGSGSIPNESTSEVRLHLKKMEEVKEELSNLNCSDTEPGSESESESELEVESEKKPLTKSQKRSIKRKSTSKLDLKIMNSSLPENEIGTDLVIGFNQARVKMRKHGKVFGTPAIKNKASTIEEVQEFQSKVMESTRNSKIIVGTFQKKDKAIICYEVEKNLCSIYSLETGEFISGWRLTETQKKELAENKNVGTIQTSKKPKTALTGTKNRTRNRPKTTKNIGQNPL